VSYLSGFSRIWELRKLSPGPVWLGLFIELAPAVDFGGPVRLHGRSEHHMRPDYLRRGDDVSHRLMRGFGLLLRIKREGHEWSATCADDVEAVKERTYYAVYCRVDLAEIVDVHFGAISEFAPP
jgi:hypothetical protein